MAERPGGRVRPASDPRATIAARAPWLPPACGASDLAALKALAAGTADPMQQQAALAYIIQLSLNGRAFYFPGADGRRETDYALGRAYVGEFLLTLIAVQTRRSSEHG